jgi:hypothetical protein
VSNDDPKPKPPFDIVKACFYLVAFVFAIYSLAILMSLVLCAWNFGAITEAHLRCFKEGGLVDALSTLLASALAFAAGRVSPPKE